MTVTISTHFGRTVARQHNLRNPRVASKEAHIDPTGTHETWLDIAPQQAYEHIFGEAVQEYNACQKRPERRIQDYYNTVCKGKQKSPVYECIAGVYAQDGTLSTQEQKAILFQYANEWQKANPCMVLIGAYFHADEASPHVHLDFIPVASGYKRGMKLQTAEIRAIEQQGFHTKGKITAQMQWQRSENGRLEAICAEHGLTVEHPQRGAGVDHVKTDLYKAKKELESFRQKADEVVALYVDEIESLDKKKSTLEADLATRYADLSICGHTVGQIYAACEAFSSVANETFGQCLDAYTVMDNYFWLLREPKSALVAVIDRRMDGKSSVESAFVAALEELSIPMTQSLDLE